MALAAALLAFGAAAPTRAAPPRCEAAAEIEPARGFVGQQLHYRLRILRRRDVGSIEWATPLSFPTFRSEWLPGITGDARIEREGETWLVFVERRALFPAHAGRLRVPAAALRCASPDGEEIVTIPALDVVVDELPAEGRPERYAGLLGPVELTAAVTPSRVHLGQTLRVSLLLRGDTNLWDATSPRPALEAAGVDVFERPAELARDAGRVLRLRRYFSYDVVPRRAGVLELPELRVPYFDPATRRYAEARARLAPIVVREAAGPATGAASSAAPAPPARPASARGAYAGWLALAAAAALGAAAGLVWLRRRRRGARLSPQREVERWLANARAAELRRDADATTAAAGRALRAALRAAPGLSAEEIAEQLPASGPAREAGRLLAELERARFSGAPPPAVAEIEASIARLRC